MANDKYIVQVEPGKPAKDGKPSIGPVYRSIFAKDGFPAPTPGLDSCWDIFRFGSAVFRNFCSENYEIVWDCASGLILVKIFAHFRQRC